MADSVLQLAVLLQRWPATCFNSWRYCDDGRQCATTRDTAMAMADNVLQLAMMANSMLQLVAMVGSWWRCCDGRQHAATCDVAAMVGSALQLVALLQWLTVRGSLQHCYDGRQHATACRSAVMAGNAP